MRPLLTSLYPSLAFCLPSGYSSRRLTVDQCRERDAGNRGEEERREELDPLRCGAMDGLFLSLNITRSLSFNRKETC